MKLPELDATDYAAIGSYLAILVGGFLAWRQLRHAQRVHREQTRPYVIVDFEFQNIYVYLSIQNIGSTIARDVRITFDKELESSTGRGSAINDSPVFRDEIPMIAPGRKISVMFDNYNRRAESKELPMQYTVNLTYRDTDGKRYKDPPYPLDLAMYEGSSIAPKGLVELVKAVEGVRDTMNKWTNHTSGLLVHGIDHDLHTRRDLRPLIREQGARVRKNEGIRAYGRWLVDRQLRRYGWKR
ncbi:hypothetical protein OG598_24950 [Micromonospora sp. NBC_00330]|uniref:hypothetical protein n=1 Tax=Micromonospora sp. NBC_00330 TaxID=2903585 RepID=UPI002E2DED85|nr:hypothetical protein [Micromonospora sp. NBC_00330]